MFYFARKGFTLAEVLITLTIIGVIAALTIPAVVKSTQNAEITSKVKKYQSLLNQAVAMYASDNGCEGNLAACGAFDGTNQKAWNALKVSFKLIKDCGAFAGCWAPGVTYKLLKGDNHVMLDGAYSKGILSDGASIMIIDIDTDTNCTADRSQTDQTPLLNTCAQFVIDVNGYKGPNQYGRDTFFWWITRSGIVYPKGSTDDSLFSDPTGTPYCDPDVAGDQYSEGSGQGCAARVLKENTVTY